MEENKSTELTLKEYIEGKQKEFDEYKAKVDAIETEFDLKEMEQELIKEMEVEDERLNNVEYVLGSDTIFDGKTYSKTTVCKLICEQLNKLEVNWSYTVGYFQMHKFWKSSPEAVNYKVLDSTLRSLQQLKFKGYEDWKSILVINEYFKENHEEYTKDMGVAMFLSQKHQAILDRLKLVSKNSIDEQDVELIDAQQAK